MLGWTKSYPTRWKGFLTACAVYEKQPNARRRAIKCIYRRRKFKFPCEIPKRRFQTRGLLFLFSSSLVTVFACSCVCVCMSSLFVRRKSVIRRIMPAAAIFGRPTLSINGCLIERYRRGRRADDGPAADRWRVIQFWFLKRIIKIMEAIEKQ